MVYVGQLRSVFVLFLGRHPKFISTKEDVLLAVDDILNPRWPYGESKILGELLTANYCRTHNVAFKIIRYHNIYGPRMGFDHVLPEFFKRVYSCENSFLIFGGEETRAFCAVEDTFRSMKAVMLNEKCNGEIVHIGNNTHEIKILDLLQKIFEIAKSFNFWRGHNVWTKKLFYGLFLLHSFLLQEVNIFHNFLRKCPGLRILSPSR